MAAPHGTPVKFAAAFVTIAFARIVALVPLPVARAAGRWLGRLAFYLVPRMRKVGMANLNLAYGDALSRQEKRRILLGAAENVGIVAAEFPRLERLLHPSFRDRHVVVEGFERLDPARGCVLIGAHLGNWEWMAPAIIGLGRATAEIVRPLDVPRLNAYVDRTRRSGRIDTIPKDHAGKSIFRRVKNGGGVGILIDQSPRTNGVPVTSFGQPCWATVAPAMVAMLTQAPIHPLAMVRGPKGRYTLTIYPALDLVRTGDRDADLVGVTQQVQDAVEALIREHPEQWLWFHRRWKRRPKLESEWNARRGNAGASPSAQ